MSLAPPFALWSNSETTAFNFRSIAARWRAEFFSWSVVLVLAVADNIRDEAAQCRAVLPSLSLTAGSALFWRSWITVSAWPCWPAKWRAVSPSWFTAFTWRNNTQIGADPNKTLGLVNVIVVSWRRYALQWTFYLWSSFDQQTHQVWSIRQSCQV